MGEVGKKVNLKSQKYFCRVSYRALVELMLNFLMCQLKFVSGSLKKSNTRPITNKPKNLLLRE
jgi:hypothetical protein